MSLKSATTNHINNISNVRDYLLPLIKEINYLNIYFSSLPLEELTDLFSYKIDDVNYQKDLYHSGDKIIVKLNLKNIKNTTKKLWLGYSLKDPLDNYLDFPGKEVTLNGKSQKTVELTIDKNYFSNDSFISGDYDAFFALWDRNPVLKGAQRISHYEKEKAIKIYSTTETFDTFKSTQWFSRKGILGRTLLTPENIFIDNQFLNIKLPKDSYSGGEIRTLETVHYGSYEISMQLPNAPSSITGFFLYKAPDYYHEIDIEIYNRKTTEILFTTYANGAVQNNTVLPLYFDPTSTFNTYRIDYYPHEVSFYVNDQLLEKFTNGFSKEPMYLMVNTWYPSWLEGTPQKDEQYLKIQWIRY